MHPSVSRAHPVVAHPASRVPVALPHPRGAEPDVADAPDAPGCIGPAWIVREVTHVPGILRLAHGRLSFLSSRGVVFDESLDAPDLDVSLPWRGRGGIRVTVGCERLRVHVVRPPGAIEPGAAFVDAVADASGLPVTRGDLEAAAVWRALLVRAQDPDRARVPRRRAPGRRAARVRRGPAAPTPSS
ncbi:hypothetical protein [Actinomycetospora soli]|uniref:hypothetical protein n=1 Tax=Actinomycetospora soli TaxID=2893887 RepID=UPI001E3DF68C|nr:hypothetical protein [Actinomycetospora soli]MCD2190154.1 hypothetical protein [Actinomycetospora soli]